VVVEEYPRRETNYVRRLWAFLTTMSMPIHAQTTNAAPAVPIKWQGTVPQITSIINGPFSCIQVTSDAANRILKVANSCQGSVSVLASRDLNYNAPFIRMVPHQGREFGLVTIPQDGFTEISGHPMRLTHCM